jgi:hypothetical protein|tara:strand:- start:607 stop:843 length:237 start_codon:yes stop_codon:yes gene_type:complete
MILNKYFSVTYFSNKDRKNITRHALWDSKCKYWVSKAGKLLMTYFDLDKEGYRTASNSWSIKEYEEENPMEDLERILK